MLKVLLIVISVCGFCYINGKTCHHTAPPLRFKVGTWRNDQTVSYNGVSVLPTSLHSCQLGHFFICSNISYTVILGDGVIAPSPPNLTSSTYLRHFLVWNRNMISSFIEFDWGELQDNVTAIELSFLNSPVNGISLPDIELTALVHYNGVRLSSLRFPFSLHQNQNLSLSDNQVMTVIIQPLIQKFSFTALRIFSRFTIFHDFDWIFMNEIKFCTDTQSSFSPLLTFSEPSSSIIQPSVDDLRKGSTVLVCTVSSEGLYTWQWERDNSVIGNNGDFRITIGDGSRTTRLTIFNFDFHDAGEYNCTATTLDGIFTNFIIQTVQFPELIVTTPNVTRQQTEEVTLICVHYRNNLFTSPVWLNTHGNKIFNSSKFTITQITLQQDGTTHSSVNVSLTIHSLTSADEGNYTCSSSNRSFSVALLSVSSPPLTNTEPSTTTDSRDITTTDSRNTSDTITIAAAVGSITIVIISLGILTVILVLVKIQHNKNKILPTQNNISYRPYNVDLTAENDFYTLEPTTSMSSKLQALDKTDSQDGGSPRESIDIPIEPLYQDINLCQEHVSESVRKTTNSTEPNLTKVVGEDFKEMLDSNPLYDRAPNKATLNKGMEDNPMYVERSQLNLCEGCMEENPIYMVEDDEHSFYTASVLDNAEPVYNEAINPHYLSHTVSGENRICNNGVIADNYDSLSPFIEPVYAVLDCSSTEPVYSEAISQENFKSDSEALSSISSSTEPVYSEAIKSDSELTSLSNTHSHIM